MQASVPLILNALHQNAQTPGGEAALSSALTQHDGSSLDQFAQGQLPSAQDGSAILGHAFGGQAPEAANTVAQHAGIDPQMAMQVLSMVAPLVLGALGRGQSQGESGSLGGSGGLAGMPGGLLGGGSAGAGAWAVLVDWAACWAGCLARVIRAGTRTKRQVILRRAISRQTPGVACWEA